jgi:hypothetical protein
MSNFSAWVGIKRVGGQWRGHVTVYRNGMPFATMLCETLWQHRDDAIHDAHYVKDVTFKNL